MHYSLRNVGIVLAVCLIAGVCHADDAVDAAFKRLVSVDIFAFGGVGYAGRTSQGEKDFRTVRSSPSALTYFEKLYCEGNLQAKCYALAGIRKLDPKRYHQLIASLENPKTEVVTQSGCIGRHEPLVSVVKQFSNGDYDWLIDRH